MGILDGVVEWISEQIMHGLDLINTSVLGALGCGMDTFLRYFPAAETMYDIFTAIGIGLILLMWVWNLFKNYWLGAGFEAEHPVKLTFRAIIFITLKYIVLDISELTGDLLTVGMFMALDFVWDKAKENRTEEKAIFIDECWQLIGASSNRLAAEFVLEIFKIIRGYGGSAVCATQDLNDFFALEDGKYGKGIINNSKTKVILNLEDEEAQRVGSILHLSEAELMEITHFERGSALISTNNNNVAVEIKCSELEKELITTDRRELQELLKRNGKTECI